MTAGAIESSVSQHGSDPWNDRQSPAGIARQYPLTVVLPAFNEAENIARLLSRIDHAIGRPGLNARILVIDDGSTDGTAEAASAVRTVTPVQVLRHDRNAGLGGAIRTGLLAAAARGGVIVTMDADDTHDPALIPTMLERIAGGCDVVIASRFETGGRTLGLSPFRRALSVGASQFLRHARPIPGARDYSCGYRAYRADLITRLVRTHGADHLVAERGFACMLELLLKSHDAQARVGEVPLVLEYARKLGRSKMHVVATLAGYRRVLAAQRRRATALRTVPVSEQRTGPQRLLNLAVAGMGLLVTAPLMVVIAFAIKLTSRGPVFFVQERVGMDRRNPAIGNNNHRRHVDLTGKPFRIYKFRTMHYQDDASEQQVWAQHDDPRVTAVGRVLRKTRLDELPQLLNVVRGEMNVVGPRPEQPDIVLQLAEQVVQYPRRHQVLPGITGWAQINQQYDTDLEGVRRKVELDLEYIQRRSVREDLRIMFRTVPVMLFRRGAW